MKINKFLKKAITIATALILGVGTVFYNGGFSIICHAEVYEGTFGYDNKGKYYYKDGFMILGGSGSTEGYNNVDRPWESLIYNITSVHVRDDVTGVLTKSFYGASNLKLLEIGPKVYQLGWLSFGSTGLVAVYGQDQSYEEGVFNIPGTVTYIDNSAFSSCYGLKKLIVNEGTKSIGQGAFNSCKSLTEVKLADTVTSIERNAFKNCTALKEITLPKNLEYMGDEVFEGCSNLETVKISSDAKNFSVANGALVDSNKKIIYYPAGSTERIYYVQNGVKGIGSYAFEYCNNIETIIIPDSVETIEGTAFYGTKNLKKINLSKNVKVAGQHIQYSKKILFCGATSLEDVYYEGTPEEFLKAFGNYDYGNANGDDINVHCNHVHNYSNVVYTSTCENAGLKKLICDCGVEKVENTPARGHEYGNAIITRKATTNTVGIKAYVCKRCRSVKTETIPKLISSSDTGSQEETDPKPQVVVNNPKVGDVVTVHADTYKITKLATSSAFGEVMFVKTADASTAVTIVDTITINNKTYNVTSVYAGALKNNKKIKKLTIGKNVKSIGKSAFYRCSKLKTVIIKSAKLTKKTVGKNAFAKINKKAKVKVPKSKLKSYKKLLKSKGLKSKSQKVTK